MGNIEKDVLILTDKTVNATIQKGSSVLLEIYTPWCGYCKKLLPEYAAAATKLKEEEKNGGAKVILAKIDATENKATADWLEVKGYPTLIWFHEGTRQPFNGERKGDAIVNWVKKRTGAPADTLETMADLEAIKSKSEVFLLGYFPAFQGNAYDHFQAAALEVTPWPTFQTQSPEIAGALGLESAPGYAVGTSFEANGKAFKAVTSPGHPAFANSDFLKNQILAFLKAEELPPFLPYSSATNERIFAVERQVFLVGPLEDLQPGGAALEAVTKAHARFKGRFAFATAAINTDPADMLLNFFGIERSPTIQVIGFFPESKKYKLLEPLSDDSLATFCQGILADTYPRFYKSAPLPEKAEENHITNVVGRNFDEVVLDTKKDVLLMVYITRSDKSKHLAVVWKKMARHMRQVDSFVAARFEATDNEHASITGKHYPYILFYPAAPGAEGIKFEGEPSLKELLKFVRKHALIPIDFKAQPPVTAGHSKPKQEL